MAAAPVEASSAAAMAVVLDGSNCSMAAHSMVRGRVSVTAVVFKTMASAAVSCEQGRRIGDCYSWLGLLNLGGSSVEVNAGETSFWRY